MDFHLWNILKKQKSELELEKKKEDQSDWIDCFCDYGFSNIPINKLAGMKIEDDPVGVYVLRDIDNEKRYVGQGKKVISRALEHFVDAADDSVSEAYKAGHRFVVERIITGYKDGADFCLNRVEADLIEYYDSANCGYNRTKGNTRATGYNGVKLARKEERIRYQRRQYLYTLRMYEKKGKELSKSGITMDILEKLAKGCDETD